MEIISDRDVLRRVSVDFDIPPAPPSLSAGGVILPLTFLRKRPLKRFDMVDESGRAVPVLSEAQTTPINSAMLVALASDAWNRTWSPGRPGSMPVEIEEDLRSLVASGSSEYSESVLARWERSFLVGDIDRSFIWSSVLVRGFMEQLARGFLLYAHLEADGAQRRIIKYSYLGDYQLDAIRMAKIWHSLGLGWLADPRDRGKREWDILINDCGVGTAGSYHAELSTPSGTVLQGAYLLVPEGETTFYVLAYDESDRVTAHLHPRYPAEEAVLLARLDPDPSAALNQAKLSALLATGILLAGLTVFVAKAFHLWLAHPDTGAAASLLVIVPAAIATVVSIQEHRLVKRFLEGVRARAAVAALVSFAAAGSLVVAQLPRGFRPALWLLLFVVSGFNALSLVRHARRASRPGSRIPPAERKA